MASIKTQKTRLYFVDPLTGTDPQVLYVECPTGIQGLGGPRDQVDDSCLEEDDASFSPGIRRPGQVTVPFVLKDNVPQGQAALEAMYDGDTPIVAWCVGLSNGEAPPTIDSDGGLEAPTDRDGWLFRGYVADLNFDIGLNEVVRGTLLIQRVGARQRFYRSVT